MTQIEEFKAVCKDVRDGVKGPTGVRVGDDVWTVEAWKGRIRLTKQYKPV